MFAVVVRFVFSGGSEIVKKSKYTSNSELEVPFLSFFHSFFFFSKFMYYHKKKRHRILP